MTELMDSLVDQLLRPFHSPFGNEGTECIDHPEVAGGQHHVSIPHIPMIQGSRPEHLCDPLSDISIYNFDSLPGITGFWSQMKGQIITERYRMEFGETEECGSDRLQCQRQISHVLPGMFQLRQQRTHHPGDDIPEQTIFAAEMMIESRLCHPRRLTYFLHSASFIAHAAEAVQGMIEQIHFRVHDANIPNGITRVKD
jgi:hypothetical protein